MMLRSFSSETWNKNHFFKGCLEFFYWITILKSMDFYDTFTQASSSKVRISKKRIQRLEQKKTVTPYSVFSRCLQLYNLFCVLEFRLRSYFQRTELFFEFEIRCINGCCHLLYWPS